MPSTSAAPNAAPNREALTQRRLNRLLNAPCSSHFLDGRGIRSAVAATDPACRVIGPFIARTFARLRRRFR